MKTNYQHKINRVMKNSLISMLLLVSVSILGQVTKSIQVTTAGTLTTLLTATEKSTITNLTITGTIDAVDFQTMRDQMPSIAVLDISAVNIAALNDLWYPSAANEIPESAFSFFGITKKYSNLKTVSLPVTATSIGRNAFNSCTGLTDITIPNGYTTIGDGAFWGCTGLLNVNIPASVTTINDVIFDNCISLKAIYVNIQTPLTFGLYVTPFYGINQTTCTLYVPVGSKAAYQVADQWKDFVNIQEIGSGEPQDGYLIQFKGSGDASVIDSVEVNNLTQNKKLLIKNGNSLRLTSTNNTASQVVTEQLMNYQSGDRLLIKGYSGKLCTILTDIPSGGKTVNFEFVTCKDVDGNYYTTVKIGNQIWMAENLRTTKYRNGDAIPLLQSDAEWTSNTQIGKYCRYYEIINNTVYDGYQKYGLLYNIKAVYDDRNIAPEGWHVSIDEDWNTLINFLGGYKVAGTKLKDSDPNYFNNFEYKTNESGFTGTPGGARLGDGSFSHNINNTGYWWVKSNEHKIMFLTGNSPYIYTVIPAYDAYSIRCVKDPTSAKYVVSATASPAEGGTVTGSGSYAIADICTVEAIPNYGYKFSNWTVNGIVINWQPTSYSFIVPGNRTLVANFVTDNTTSTTVQPQISINPGVVNLGAKVTITGKNFTPNKTVKILIVSKDGGFEETITADTAGNIKFDYTAPSVVSSSNGVEVEVIVRDNATAFTVPSKWFKIIVPKTTNAALINILSLDNTYKVNHPITVSWTEMLYKAAGGVTYPFDAKTGYRSYSYNVELKTSETGSWTLKKLVQGSAMFDKVLMQNFQFELDQAYTYCQVRIVDNHNSQSVALSTVFAVEPSILGTALAWDYSFPNRTGWPRGVAADGVARVYLKVKLDKIDKKPIVTVKLSADGISESSIDLLGKVMKATVTDKYHTEANAANLITASSNIIDTDGYVWFWYVAPENFTSGGINSPLAYASERTVNATISVSYEDGSPLPDVVQPIKIVRPPLMMVHGVNSNNQCFDNFHYYRGSVGPIYFSDRNDAENPTLQPKTTLFQVNQAVNLKNNQGLYMENALQMISDYPTSDNIKGNIAAIRQRGFASNQVDYVCHSMGGAVLRTVIEKCSNNFLGNGGITKYPYQNYGQGFVHKAITINTPHNGSTVADALTEFIPKCPTNSTNPINAAIFDIWYYNKKTIFGVKNDYGGFFIPKYVGKDNLGFDSFSFDVSDAVKNLQVQGEKGIKFGITNVKNHLIAGDVDLSKENAQTFIKDNKWFKIFLVANAIVGINDKGSIGINNNGSVSESVLLYNLVKGITSEAYNFMTQYSETKGFANYFTDGDLIVPLNSQLAGVSESSTTVTKFSNSGKDPFDSNHSQIVDRTEVGNRVLELLNSDVNGNLFANSIPANTVHKANVSSQAPQKVKQEVKDTTYINTRKIEIVSPARSSIVYADSTVNIAYNLKDTANLAYINYSFQGDFDVSVSRANVQQYNLQINANYLGKQTIVVSAVYVFPDSAVTYIDTLSVDVQTKAQLIHFQASPSVMYMYKGVQYHPTLKATFSSGIVNIPFNSPDLTVEIDNPKLVKYNAFYNSFEGLDTLTTFAKITYKGISDTIYFSVMDTISQAIPDNINGLIKNLQPASNLLGVNAYPNPFNDSFTFEFTLPTSGSSKLEVYNIYGIKVKELFFGAEPAGFYKKKIDMKGMLPGIYIYKLSAGMVTENGTLLKMQTN